MFKCVGCGNAVGESVMKCPVCGETLEKFVDIYKKAQGNDAASQATLGALYRRGLYVDFDLKKGFYWTKKAAEAGFVEAQGCLGNLYYNGQGTPVDYKKAFYWTKKAVEQGNSIAKNDLALCYAYGNGTEANVVRAIYWFIQARNDGDVNAANNLRTLHIADATFLNEDTPLHIKYIEE